MGCKKPIILEVADPGVGRVRVEASLHERGCMGARYTHLDIPLERLRGSVLEALSSPRGGVRLRASPIGEGCLELTPPGGLPPVVICTAQAGLLGRARGHAYLKRVRGKLYLALPEPHI